MYNYLSIPAIWFIVGFVFFLFEFAVPGFILFFFGLGAWITALISYLFEVPVNFQILFFLASSVLTVLLIRRWVKNKLGMMQTSKSFLEDEIIGKTGIAESLIMPDAPGRVLFKGTSWSASSSDIIKPGERVTILANKSIQLIVKLSTS